MLMIATWHRAPADGRRARSGRPGAAPALFHVVVVIAGKLIAQSSTR